MAVPTPCGTATALSGLLEVNGPMLVRVATEVLATSRGDNGPAVLGALLMDHSEAAAAADRSEAAAAADRAVAAAAADRAVAGWLTAGRSAAHLGAYGDGLTARHHGVLAACRARPRLTRLAHASRGALTAHCRRPGTWRTDGVGWEDYDLVTGAAGALLALCADPDATADDRAPILRQLVTLAADPGLDRLRIRVGAGPGRSPWNLGRINLGVAHGIAGMVLALCAAADRQPLAPAETTALRTLTNRLVAEAYRDRHGVLTWPPVARDDTGDTVPAPVRHAWCYGTPGIAWSLHEAGRVLADPALSTFATAAFDSFLSAGCPNHNVSALEGLAVCHGDAGLLLLCDTFDRYADSTAAAATRDLLDARLHRHLADLCGPAATDRSLLTGSAGILAALLTVRGGDRTWLAQIGLR